MCKIGPTLRYRVVTKGRVQLFLKRRGLEHFTKSVSFKIFPQIVFYKLSWLPLSLEEEEACPQMITLHKVKASKHLLEGTFTKYEKADYGDPCSTEEKCNVP